MKESDVRPSELYKKYLDLSIKDSLSFCPITSHEEIPCACCGSCNIAYSFSKYGFSYYQCNICTLLFLNPRPQQRT